MALGLTAPQQGGRTWLVILSQLVRRVVVRNGSEVRLHPFPMELGAAWLAGRV